MKLYVECFELYTKKIVTTTIDINYLYIVY